MNTPDVTEELASVNASAPVSGSETRPHAEQSALERVLRSHLWKPNDILERGKTALPKCVKAKEYREAAEWQTRMMEAEREKEEWLYILDLYEQERKSLNVRVSESARE